MAWVMACSLREHMAFNWCLHILNSRDHQKYCMGIHSIKCLIRKKSAMATIYAWTFRGQVTHMYIHIIDC